MVSYLYGPFPAVDGQTGAPVPNATGKVYAPTDVELTTPLDVTDLAGVVTTDVRSTPNSLVTAFTIEDQPDGLIWASGPYRVPLIPFQSLVDAAEAAQAAAEEAASVFPAGGSLGQVLTKISAGDFDVAWGDPAAGTGGGISRLDQAADVAITTPAAGQGLLWNGVAWVNAAVSSVSTEVMFSTLVGANDDAKLDAFMDANRNQTMKGKILVRDEVRDYTFTQQHLLYHGFAWRGALRPQDQPRSSLPIGNRLRLRIAGGTPTAPKGLFTTPAGNLFGISISNDSIDGDPNSIYVEGNPAGIFWTSNFRDISCQNAAGVLGTPENPLRFTASSIDGWWNVNNVRNRAICIQGSDHWFNPTMFLLDSPPELLPDDKYLMSHDFMSNSWTRGIYCTAEGHSAYLITGSNTSSNSNWVFDSVFEGRNAGQPCKGALIRMTGGQYMFDRCRFAFAMTNPAATGRNDAGVFHISGGNLVLDKCTYQRATGVAETVPLLYATGTAKVRISHMIGVGSGWTGKPVVRQSVEGLIEADDSVIVVTDTTAEALTGAGNVVSGFTNAGTSLVLGKPANTADGDLLVAAVWNRNGSAPFTTPPDGFNPLPPAVDNTASGVLRFYVHAVADADLEPADYTWAGGTSGRNVGLIFRVIDADLGTPSHVAGSVATLISGPDRVILPGLTTTAANKLLLGAAGGNNTGGIVPSFTQSAMTLIGSAGTTTGASESGLTVFAEKLGAAGASGTRSAPAVPAAASGLGYMVALNSE